MSVRAKMQVTSVEHYGYGGKQVKLSAVYGTEGENKDFADATPSGQASYTISKGARAGEYFQPGKSYYVTFEEAPA